MKKGSHHTSETRAKMRSSHLGKKLSPETRAKIGAAHRGKVVSAETRAKLRVATHAAGPAHWNWRGGDRDYGTGFTKDLKRIVRWLYDNRCFICGEKPDGKETAVHHIDYDKKNNTIDNLVPLCNSHHSQTNTRRDYWQWFFKNRQRSRSLLWEWVA